MSPRFALLVASAMLVGIALSGCSDFDEMKGQRALLDAEALIEKMENVRAETSLADLVARYPATQAAELGRKRLNYLVVLRERRERREMADILDSFSQVFNGYRSLYAQYPQSVQELDQSGYFFDSEYLGSVAPEPFRVYLYLQDDGRGFHIWCVHDARTRGYGVSAASQGLVPFQKDGLQTNLRQRFDSDDWEAKVVVLTGRGG